MVMISDESTGTHTDTDEDTVEDLLEVHQLQLISPVESNGF
jgi:hypothetical protein